MTRNLGATSLRRTRRSCDPLRRYGAVPAPLRQWLSQAAQPWSPATARRERCSGVGAPVSQG